MICERQGAVWKKSLALSHDHVVRVGIPSECEPVNASEA